MKLMYWYAERIGDDNAYSIRTRTKREAVANREKSPAHYGEIKKIVVEYADAFDLLTRCLDEGGIGESWRPDARKKTK